MSKLCFELEQSQEFEQKQNLLRWKYRCLTEIEWSGESQDDKVIYKN